MEKAKELLIEKAKYSIEVKLPSMLPFKSAMNETVRILAQENERIESKCYSSLDEELAQWNEKIEFKCYSGLDENSIGVCVMSGPLKKADIMDRYIEEALGKYPKGLERPKVTHRVESKAEF
jgi:hypothetical protein